MESRDTGDGVGCDGGVPDWSDSIDCADAVDSVPHCGRPLCGDLLHHPPPHDHLVGIPRNTTVHLRQ